MALINCSECQREISDQAKTCPGCGASLKNDSGKARLGIGIALAIPFVAIVVLLSMPTSPEAKEMASDRETIKRCWDEQQRKSLTPDSQRLVATLCEQKEAGYRAKRKESP